MNEHNCRVCGLYVEDSPWGKDGCCPTYEICPCCGVEFGNEDYTVESAKTFRKNWLNNGNVWFLPAKKPVNWNLLDQLKNIPKEFS